MDKVELIKKAKNAYYNTSEPIMSDTEYDRLVAEVGKETVGAPILDNLKKINISDRSMLSLNKCHSAEEIKEFANGQTLVSSIKCDGLSVRLIYEKGILVSANTRGNGEVGQDITAHVKQFTNVPLVVNTSERLIIDGEAIIFQHDFDEINKNNQFKNPRNLAAGTLASLDTSLCKERRMSFIAWDFIEGSNVKDYFSRLVELMDLGFYSVPCFVCNSIFDEIAYYDNTNKDLLNLAKEKGIPCDGVVWRINDVEYGESLGKTAHHFLNAIAWKPAITEVETTLMDITWDVSRRGILTPVAVFKPVEFDGSVIEKASLSNITIMEQLLGKPFVGQKISVSKRNMIIPCIEDAQNELGEWINGRNMANN